MARAALIDPALSWWATAGDETCPVCLQRYHYHIEVRCTDCDQRLCPSCAVRLTVEVVEHHCPDCRTAAVEEAF
jgi:hypothetical protein